MKCLLIYYSQTGNTEKIAKAIQVGIKRTACECTIVKMNEADPKRLYEYDLIGLGGPVGFEAGYISVFINKMRFVGGKHAFAFCTHGGNPDCFFPTVVPKLKRRGLTVIGTRDWYGNCTLLHHIEPYPTAGHPDEIDLKEAEDFGREIVGLSQRIQSGEVDLIPPAPKVLKPSTKEELSGADVIRSFQSLLKYHKEKCLYPKCRLCMDNCPMDGIDLTVNPPVIAKPCQFCEWCARICPTGAIDILDWLEALTKTFGAGDSMMKTLVMPKLAKAEEEGRFRRHLPISEITYTPRYKLHKTHPYAKILK